MKKLIVFIIAFMPHIFNMSVYENCKYLDELVFDVTATVYFPSPKQTDSTPLITASNKHINPEDPYSHRWIAVSRDIISSPHVNFGDTVIVEGTEVYDGEWVVNDLMNKRFDNKIDFLVSDRNVVDRFDGVTLTVK